MTTFVSIPTPAAGPVSAYTTTCTYNAATGLLSGVLSLRPGGGQVNGPCAGGGPTVGGVVMSAYADGFTAPIAPPNDADSSGNWSINTAALASGAHVIEVWANYIPVATINVTK